MATYILSERPATYWGSYTGYPVLARYLKKYPEIKILAPKNSYLQKIFGYLLSLTDKAKRHRCKTSLALEYLFQRYVLSRPKNIGHILWVEAHLGFLKQFKKAPPNVIGTIHHSPYHWRMFWGNDIKYLKRLSFAILLYRKDISFFESYVGRNRVKFVHHGVDTEYFCPNKNVESENKKILYIAGTGRNTGMLHRVVKRLLEIDSELTFDFVVPNHIMNWHDFPELLSNPRVFWHHNIFDKRLLFLYRRAHILLLPMGEHAASNTVLESLSCGLPIVTTDMGGIRDYGGVSIYPVVANNDEEAMIELIKKYLATPMWRNKIANKCREFAEENLAWPIIAEKQMKIYKEFVV